MATFPTLSTPEILSVLSEINCPVPPEFDVDRPTSKGISAVYWWFWEYTTTIAPQDAKEATDAYMENVLNQGNGEVEMYGEGLQLGIQFETLKQMMIWAMLDDFTLRDLRDPTAPRVRKILSALINFHLFSREQEPLIEGLEDAHQAELDAQQATAEEIELWQRKIDDKKAQLVREREEVERLSKENEERRIKLVRLKEMEEPTVLRMETAKRERGTLQEKMENITMGIKQHDGEIARLRGRIVQSPDRVRQTLNDMAASLQALKDELVEVDRKAREHESRIAVARKYEGEIGGTIKLLDEWSSELARLNEISSRLSSLVEQRDASSETLSELTLRHQQLERRLQSTSEQLDRQESLAQTKKHQLRSKTGKLQEQYETLMLEREGIQAQQELKAKECRKVTEAIEELTKVAHQETDIAKAALNELRDDVLTYSAKLNKALDSLNAAVERPFGSG